MNKPLQFVLDKDGALRASPTFPSTMITVGDAIPEPLIDTLAFGSGLKCIVPFAPPDPQSGSKYRSGRHARGESEGGGTGTTNLHPVHSF